MFWPRTTGLVGAFVPGYTCRGRNRWVPIQSVERKLAAIFAADIEGYSRLMGRDEVGTLDRLKAYRTIIDGLIAGHRGRRQGSRP
jgi:class 3 adenylate cyclase